MTEKTPRATERKLFEINLIGDRVDRLRRRRALSRVGDAAAVVMAAAALVFCVLTAFDLFGIMRLRDDLRTLGRQLAEEQKVAEKLDAMRGDVVKKVGNLKVLVPIAQRRVSWAPKLAALARALPAGMGVAKVRVESGDLFADPNDPKRKKRRKRSDEIDAAHLVFSVVYLPKASRTLDPMGDLRENLESNGEFMEKMEFVRLEAQAEEVWNGLQVEFFHGLLKGVEEAKHEP